MRRKPGRRSSREARLTPEHKKLLAEIVTPDGPFAQYVSRWQKLARELGASDKERTRLLAQKGFGATKTDAQNARTEWVRAVDVLVKTIRLAKLTPEQAELLTGPLTKAVDSATRRGKGGEDEPEEGGGGGGAGGGGAGGGGAGGGGAGGGGAGGGGAGGGGAGGGGAGGA